MLISLQEVFVDTFYTCRTGSSFYPSLSGNAVHAVFAILLGAEVLALLIGFLLLHHLHHLGIGLGQVNGRLDFDTKVVEIILIVGLELLNHRHALLLRQGSIINGLLECL